MNSQGLIIVYKQTIKLFICIKLKAIVDTQAQSLRSFIHLILACEEGRNFFYPPSLPNHAILGLVQYIIAIKQGRDHVLIRFKCNLFSVSECVVCASGHPSSILDHEFPMIIKGEYKVHLLNDKKC